MTRNFYERLGVNRDAPQDEIHKAFRRKALEYHPDRNRSPDSEDNFKGINEAYQTLSDPDKRAEHDIIVMRTRAGAGIRRATGMVCGERSEV